MTLTDNATQSASKKDVDERLFLPKAEVEDLERDILRRRHVERYAVARQFVYGATADMACGCGYGTHILAKNPDVTKAFGVDMYDKAIEFAEEEYGSDRVSYVCGPIETVDLGHLDTLVSIETIEHLDDPKTLNDFADRHTIETLVVSFPIKKTTHYNKFHKWDLKTQDLSDIFFNYEITREFLFQYDTCFVCMVRHNRPGAPEKRWRFPTDR